MPLGSTVDGNSHSQCLERDDFTCIFRGAPDPEACHIIPFTADSTQVGIDKLAHLGGAYRHFWPDDEDPYCRLILARPGASGKALSMLSMTRQIHLWWAKALFVIKCLDVTPSGDGEAKVGMQFHWMQRRVLHDPDCKIGLDKFWSSEDTVEMIEVLRR